MTPLNFSDEQLAELLRLAVLIENRAALDKYFEMVAQALRGRSISDLSVRVAANAAFAAMAPREIEPHVEMSDSCVLGRIVGQRWATR